MWIQVRLKRKAGARSITQGILGLVKILVNDLAKFTQQVNEKDSKPRSSGSKACGPFTTLYYKGAKEKKAHISCHSEFKKR